MGRDDRLSADVVVLGGGMAGMTVAATAAQAGASVVVVDVADRPGGSAALSEGYVWTAPSAEVFTEQDPGGDVERFGAMLEGLPEAFAWVESLGVQVGPQLSGILGFGTGRQIDVLGYLRRCRGLVEGGGGWVLPSTEPVRLLRDADAVTGVRVREAGDGSGETMEIEAPAVVLATGGFQADPEAREELLFPGAGRLVLRASPYGRGGGLRLGTAAGGDLTGPTDGFYGHLVPYPIEDFAPKDFALLAQYHSEHGLLFGRDGRRFTDESLGDHVNTELVARRGTALLLIDERIRREQVLRPFIPGMDAVDKMAEAGARGAHYATGPTVADVASAASAWGYPASLIERGVAEFNAAVRRGTCDRRYHRMPLTEPPFAVLEVQAAITFTYRGLATDVDGRVLGGGRPVPGLYAAGVDAGGLNVRGYTGGLVRGLVLGRRTGRAVVSG
ncbi:MAG TPA: FAD-dependent oxidoreductase [Spirillospora sp.]